MSSKRKKKKKIKYKNIPSANIQTPYDENIVFTKYRTKQIITDGIFSFLGYLCIVAGILCIAYAGYIFMIIPLQERNSISHIRPEVAKQKGIISIRYHDSEFEYEWKDNILKSGTIKIPLDIKEKNELFVFLCDDVIPELKEDSSKVDNDKGWYFILYQDQTRKVLKSNKVENNRILEFNKMIKKIIDENKEKNNE